MLGAWRLALGLPSRLAIGDAHKYACALSAQHLLRVHAGETPATQSHLGSIFDIFKHECQYDHFCHECGKSRGCDEIAPRSRLDARMTHVVPYQRDITCLHRTVIILEC
jgi:hypothetical protein